jgi:hypothetical protein
MRLDLLTLAWLGRLLARAIAGDARRTLRRRGLGWR